MFQQIFYGIILIAIGIALVIYSRKLVEWFGTMATAERYLGSGGTYTALRLIGIVVIVAGVMYMTGFFGDSLSVGLKGLNPAN